MRLLALVLGNAVLSAATTIIWDRQIGYKKKRQRGSISNNNGNLGLFLLCAFACKKPSHMLFNGKTILTKIPFIFLPMIFIMIYFQKFSDERSKVTARNFNETHIGAVFNALLLTLII